MYFVPSTPWILERRRTSDSTVRVTPQNGLAMSATTVLRTLDVDGVVVVAVARLHPPAAGGVVECPILGSAASLAAEDLNHELLLARSRTANATRSPATVDGEPPPLDVPPPWLLADWCE